MNLQKKMQLAIWQAAIDLGFQFNETDAWVMQKIVQKQIDSMGHIQKMTEKQRMDFLTNAYQARKESRRGECAAYLSDEKREELKNKGYTEHLFECGKRETNSIHYAKEVVLKLRESNNFARAVVNPCYNIKGAQTYAVLFKPKKHTPKIC